MNKLFLLMLLISFVSYSQDSQFKFTKDGLTDYIVVACEGKSHNEIYKKTLDWISINSNNPKEVVKSSIENEYVRFEGSSPEMIVHHSLLKYVYTGKYTIEISFKDGRFKFDVIALGYYHPDSDISPGRDIDVLKGPMSEYFKKDGNIRSKYKDYPKNIEGKFNALAESLKDFILSKEVTSKKGEW